MIGAVQISKARILIVDDQEANVLLLEQTLQGAGYVSVSSTRRPEEVGELHRKNSYDLILLDLQMPGMDGFEVMSALKEFQTGGDLPVLAITAHPGHKVRALKAGAKDFLSQPLDLAEVLVRVYNLLEVRLLHQSESLAHVARLENSQRIAGLGDWEYDFATQRLTWSEETYRILEIERTNAPPTSEAFYRKVHPDDLAFVYAKKKAGAPRRVAFEFRIVWTGGEVRYLHQIFELTLDDRGQPGKESGTLQDITERKRSEEAFRHSEERHRKMLMFSPDACFLHVAGVITLVNRAFCQLMGADEPGRLVGRLAMTVAHGDFHGLVRERQEKLFNDTAMPPSEMKFVRLDGSVVDVEVASMAFEILGRTEVQVIARDISSRKQAEATLRESENRFKLVTRAVSDVVWDWDLLTHTLWWSDGLLSVFGFIGQDIEPTDVSRTRRIHPDERARVMASVRAAIDGGSESWSADYRFERKDGSYASVQDRGYILRDASGRGIRMVGGMRDFTEQKKLEAQALRAQRMDSLGTLASGISHDLNNVLAPIMMSIEILQLEAGGTPQRNKILEVIYASCRRGADLVRQILSFAQGRDGERVAIRLAGLIDDLKGIIGETFPRNIQIVSEVPAGLWPVSGDPTQLHQVMLNLAVNARDAMPTGGQLRFAAGNVTIAQREANAHPGARAGTHVLLRVSDTGVGIPPEIRNRIFEPFFTTKETGKGTGLGLATVHTIVKNHGGFLAVESEPGKGTSFLIHLPADPALRTVEPVATGSPTLPLGREELVLVVDDEFSIRHITRESLEAFGYRVLTAGDGPEAIALYSSQAAQIAVVIIDGMMPIMDGEATSQALRHINPSVRIIKASGREPPEIGVAGEIRDKRDFLPKPYSAEALVRLVREVIDRP